MQWSIYALEDVCSEVYVLVGVYSEDCAVLGVCSGGYWLAVGFFTQWLIGGLSQRSDLPLLHTEALLTLGPAQDPPFQLLLGPQWLQTANLWARHCAIEMSYCRGLCEFM